MTESAAAESMRILLAATRVNQRYTTQDRNDVYEDCASVMDSAYGQRLLRAAARSNNQYSPRNRSPRGLSSTSFSYSTSKPYYRSERLDFE